MGYTLELSLNLHKYGNYTEINNTITEIAAINLCNSIYHFFEVEGSKQVDRSHCIFVISFDNHTDCINFLKSIKKYRYLKLETIYDNSSKIIYASSYYRQNKMTREGRIIYKKREKTNYDNEITNQLTS